MDRRTFISTTSAVGATFVAGCGGTSGDGGGEAGGDGTTEGDATESAATAESTTGTFRLLVSDRPAAIGDFDSLDVTFDRARVFRAESEAESETETEESETETETETETTETETESETETETETTETEETEDDGEGDEGDFQTFDLDDPTVDLTEVVGEKAVGVLEGKLETGRYTKIELSVSNVEGVVDGETVPVKVPSEKLQITKSFEVTAGEGVDFVFDINVVKKGQNGYNLLPVISESGVAGRDVDVEEVEKSTDSETSTATDGGTETEDETDS